MKQKNHTFFRILLMVVLYALIRPVATHYLETREVWPAFWLLLLTGILGIFIQLMAHELGHLVGGALTGYRFSSLRVLHLLLVKKPTGLRLFWPAIDGRGGQCVMEPPQVPLEKLPVVWYNLGGILANLLLTLVFVALYALADLGDWGRLFSGLNAAMGVYTLLANALPFVGPYNDASNLLRMRKDPEEKRTFRDTMRLHCAMDRDVPPRMLPEEWFQGNGEPLFPGVYILRLLDQQRYQEARQLTERYLTPETPPVLRREMLMFRLLCHAFLEGGGPPLLELCTPELQAHLNRQKKDLGTLRTRYLLAMLGRKNPQQAEFWLKQCHRRMKRYSNRGYVALEEKLLAHIRKKAAETP